MLEVIGVGMILLGVLGVLAAVARSFWRQSERQRQRWESRRGEDESPDRFDDRGALHRHWGGMGRPGGGGL